MKESIEIRVIDDEYIQDINNRRNETKAERRDRRKQQMDTNLNKLSEIEIHRKRERYFNSKTNELINLADEVKSGDFSPHLVGSAFISIIRDYKIK